MKILNTRQEIAKAINIKRLPVITIDQAQADSYGLKSQKILIDNGLMKNGTPDLIPSEIRVYADEMKFKFTSHGYCLKADFGYSDLTEMVEYAQAPVVKPDSDIVIIVMNSEKHTAFHPIVMHTGKRVDPFCSTPLGFDEEDASAKAYICGARQDLVSEWLERRSKYLGRKMAGF